MLIVLSMLLLVAGHVAALEGYQEPLRVQSGEALIGIYFNGYKASPWKSDDAKVGEDLARIRAMGANALFAVHGPVEAISDDWEAFDREHALAKAAGLSILPGLEIQAGTELSNEKVAQKYSIAVPKAENRNQEKQNSLVTSDEFRDALTRYATDYLDRYLEKGAILRLLDGGKPKPVIALSFETGWLGVSFDKETTTRFWKKIYQHYMASGWNIGTLNFNWGTRIPDFAEINPKDPLIFDYDFILPDDKRLWRPMSEHAMFRADLVNEALTVVRDRLLEKYPDLLFAAEIPYPFECPARKAIVYKWNAASLPRIVNHADLVLVRTAGDLTGAEQNALLDLIESGRQVVLCHSVAKDFGFGRKLRPIFYEHFVPTLTAQFSNGLGFYSWNEVLSHNFGRDPELVGKAESIAKAYGQIYSATGN